MSISQKEHLSNMEVSLVGSSDRILGALYLVTSLLDESEPLRTSIRDKGISVSDSIGHILFSSTHIASHIRQTQLAVQKVLSLLSVARTAGLISEMNYSILRRAYEKLSTEISRIIESTFDKKFDIIEAPLVETVSSLESTFTNNGAHTTSSVKNFPIRDKKAPTATPRTRNDEYVKDTKKTSSDRREIILSIIKDKGPVSIKDISTVFTDCSEKTIQRELTALISEGVITKKGERRWSTYAIS
ncbi:MAG: DeoR family transcriptional regulator [Candidatus Paceibacterota bacterium]